MEGRTETRVVRKRLVPKRENGLFNPRAAFWKGERAEQIVKTRVAGYTKKKPRKTLTLKLRSKPT